MKARARIGDRTPAMTALRRADCEVETIATPTRATHQRQADEHRHAHTDSQLPTRVNRSFAIGDGKRCTCDGDEEEGFHYASETRREGKGSDSPATIVQEASVAYHAHGSIRQRPDQDLSVSAQYSNEHS